MKHKIILIIFILLIAWGIYFLISWKAVALASKCFGFAFAWKYVWFLWFILCFVTGFFKSNN